MNTQLLDDLSCIRTSKDVRNLRVCCRCGQLGDGRHMVRVSGHRPQGEAHGRCFVAAFGLRALIALPLGEREKLTLGDIGVVAMKAVLSKRPVPLPKIPLRRPS